MEQVLSIHSEANTTDNFYPNLLSREVLTMYRTINIDVSYWIDKFLKEKSGLITAINWDDFDKFVAHAHNFELN